MAETPAPAATNDIAESSYVRAAVRVAILAAGRGDPEGWRHAAAAACASDLMAADLAARAELGDRLAEQGVELGMVSAIASGARALAAATEGGPFACPAYLFELAVRRALDEPGCVDHVDIGELVGATTQCCGLLDIYDTLLPAGWGWAIHLPLPVD